MRDMAGEYKMTLRTLWDVNDFLNDLEARTARDPGSWMVHREDGGRKKPTRAAIVTAALLALRSLPRDRQDAAIREGMAALNDTIAAREVAPAPERPLFGAAEPPATPPSKKSRRA